MAAGDPATLPDRFAHAFVQWMETDVANAPLFALLRSAASDERAAAHLRAAMPEHSTDVYRSVLSPDEPTTPDEDLNARVALVGARMIGVAFTRYVARTEPLASMPPDQLTEHLIRILWHALFG
ncbi:TetR/AcrR family transcriptional regulator [Streptomyces sp. NPDC054834]